jgi:hypothetical protein
MAYVRRGRASTTISLRSVRAADRTLVIEGSAATAEALAAMIRQLSGSPFLERAAIVSTRTDEQWRLEAFRIEAKMKHMADVSQ